MKMCAIYDSKAEAWTTPMFFQATGQAVRSFGDAVADEKSEFGKHPEDYVLFLLGDWDERSGKCEVLQAPVALARGLDLATREVVK